ncbi:hypothetical protein FACS1894167_03710 [Synergistales bacterium]|nr:hypothetical protein FACS1894167_03710 [Synergistales bacterium]
MTTGKRAAFTFVEIMVVVGIACLIAVIGLVPLMYTARTMSSGVKDFTKANREEDAVNSIYLDTRGVSSLLGGASVKVQHKEGLNDKRDYLFLRTLTPAQSMRPAGTVVYGLPPDELFDRSKYKDGLYRWLLSPDVTAGSSDITEFPFENSKLILDGVTGVRFLALSDQDWAESYSGGIPQALRIILTFKDSAEEKTYDVWLPKF